MIFRIARAQLLDTPSTVLKCVYTKENVNKAWKNISPKVRSLCFALKGPARLRLKRSIKRNLLGRWLNWIISFLKEKSIFCKAVAYVLRDLRVSNSFCWPSFEDCTTLKAMKPKMLHQLTHLCAMGQ